MVKKGTFRLLAFVLALTLLGQAVYATPTPPYLVVNHANKECAESILGDDCSWCDPPPGWEVVGPSDTNPCPEGYRRLERIDMLCRAYETPFCCSGGGHRGDCEDMVVHDGDRSCAFVEDVHDCALPDGWRARPPDVDPVRWSCPMAYGWLDAVECLSQELEPTEPPTIVPVPLVTAVQPTVTPLPLATTAQPAATPAPRVDLALAVGCLLAVLVAVAAVGLVLVFVVVRRRGA